MKVRFRFQTPSNSSRLVFCLFLILEFFEKNNARLSVQKSVFYMQTFFWIFGPYWISFIFLPHRGFKVTQKLLCVAFSVSLFYLECHVCEAKIDKISKIKKRSNNFVIWNEKHGHFRRKSLPVLTVFFFLSFPVLAGDQCC